MKPLNVIYISGTGHSGTTLLGLILGAQEGVGNLGEVHGYENDYLVNRKCTCGERVQNCTFWSLIFKKYTHRLRQENFNGVYNFDYPSKGLDFEKTAFIKRVRSHLVEDISNLFSDRYKEKYILSNYLLLQAYLEIAQTDIFVDTSKNLFRLAILSKSDLFNIKPIFVFRDVRALIESEMRRHPRPFLDQVGFTSLAKTLRWKLQWRKFRKFIRNNFAKSNYMTITYEDFCNHTENVVRLISKFIGVKFDPKTLDLNSDNHFSKQAPGQHLFTGNKIKDHVPLKIRKVERWENALSGLDKMIIKVVGSDGNIDVVE